MPAASITTTKHSCTAIWGSLPKSLAPSTPPATLPSAAGIITERYAYPPIIYDTALTAHTGAITAMAVAWASFLF